MTKNIHIAVASTTSKPGDVAGNLRQIADLAARAAADQADLLLTPEMSASGYGGYPEVLATAEKAGDGPIYRELAAIAARCRLVVLAGFVEAHENRNYLAHYAVWPDGQFIVQRKNRVTKNEKPLDTMMTLIYESANDEIGQPVGPPIFTFFEIRGVRCAITICADGGLNSISGIMAANGVELLLGPAGAGGRREERVITADLHTFEGRAVYSKWLEMTCFPGRSGIEACIRHCRAQAAVNLCGYDGKRLYHMGHGTIITPMGEIAALVHGLPNLDRQRPMYCHAVVDVADRLMAPKDSVTRT